jgi:dTDP-4-amino-4,6-dideoxygalactose transaminase
VTWPSYSAACRNSIQGLLMQGGSLSAYRANKAYGAEPKLGSWAQRLESQLAMRMGVKYAVACNSGTAALQAAIAPALSKSGNARREVIVSPYTFSASAAAIVLSGYTPVFADVDPQSFCITKKTASKVLSKRTAGIVPVALFGGMHEDFSSLGVQVISDQCQAVGSNAPNRATSIAISMNGGKNIPAGECGAFLTNNYKLAEAARMIVNHGENFGKDAVGFNFRPNELTACVAYHGLMELGANNRERINLAEALTSLIRNEPKLRKYIEIPESVKFDGSHVFYVYPFKIKNMSRKLFAARMKNRFGITVGEGYINPCLHEYKAFRKYARGRLPVVESLSRESLCLFYDVTPGATVKDMENKVDAMVQCATSRDRR